MKTPSSINPLLVTVILGYALANLQGQAQPAERRGQRPPAVVSPEVSPERKVTFRVHAPNATELRLNSSDLGGAARDATWTKGGEGVWEATVGPVKPGSYRYHIQVDGLAVVDPRNPATSESNANTWSLVHVPGAAFMDTQNVPHGAVSEVTYYSKTLERFRRLHVYTPPGYESGQGTFPVFYLLHGASDCDDSWSSVGRAGFILDNLIAQKEAKPMVVVMPAGHTGPFGSGSRARDEFERDFIHDIMPLIEARYRVGKKREDRAIAGLSMGGAQTLNVGIPHLEKFAYLGVYSSGVFGINRERTGDDANNPTWEERNQAKLNDGELKDGLKLFWFATGKDDFLVETTRATVEMFKKHGFDVVYHETDGAHTWDKWRDYLHEFTPLLFQP